MRPFLMFSLFVYVCGVSVAAFSQGTPGTTMAQDAAQSKSATIEGLVRDIACPIQNPKATATHLSVKCLRACARAGSPIVILTQSGEMYVPISNQMPDTDQRQTLAPFLGKYVQASGTVYERRGTRAIAITKIEEVKGVHLNIEDK